MKKLFFLALGCLTLSLGFTACEDDDDFVVDNSDVLAPVDFNLQTDLSGYFNGTLGLTAYSGNLTDGGPFVTESRSLTLTPNSDNTLDIDFGEFKLNAVLFVGNMESLVFEKCAVTLTNDGCTFTGSAIINEEDSDFESTLSGEYNKRDNVVSIVVTILSENPTLDGSQRLGDDWKITFDGEYSETQLSEEVEEEVAPNLIYTGTMNVNVSSSDMPLDDIEIYAYFDENGDFDSLVISELSLSIEAFGMSISIYNIPISISTFDADGSFTGSAHVVYDSVGIDDYMDIEGTVEGNTISLTSGELSVLGAITLSFTYQGETPTTYYFGDSSIIVNETETVVSTSIYTTSDENGEVTGVTISKLSIDTGIILTFTDVEVDGFELDGDSYSGTATIYYEDLGISATFAVSGTIADNTVTMKSDEQTVLGLLTISFSFEGAPKY